MTIQNQTCLALETILRANLVPVQTLPLSVSVLGLRHVMKGGETIVMVEDGPKCQKIMLLSTRGKENHLKNHESKMLGHILLFAVYALSYFMV